VGKGGGGRRATGEGGDLLAFGGGGRTTTDVGGQIKWEVQTTPSQTPSKGSLNEEANAEVRIGNNLGNLQRENKKEKGIDSKDD